MIRTHSLLGSLRTGFLLFLLLPLSITAFAQTEVSYRRGATQLEDILPPSPEAASRVKYTDVPFTHSMGAAEYSVPIYEMKGRRLTIPISLDDKYTLCFWSKQWQCLYLHVRRCTSYYSNEVFCNAKR